MQNAQTLIDLGFTINANGQYIFKGEQRTFLAQVTTCNGPVYIELFYLSKKIDNRPLSKNFGKPLVGRIKDCCTNGSVERAIKQHDYDEENPRRPT
jgi:hypothetical protein